MKKLLIVLCAFLVGFSQTANAQKPHSDLHNELGVNAGPVSLVGGFIYGTVGFWTALGGELSHKPIDMHLCGQYSIHYYYQVKPWCNIGVKATVEAAKLVHYSDTLRTSITGVDHDVLFSLMPSVRFNYLNRPWVRLYSGLDLGVGYLLTNSSSSSDSKDGEEGSGKKNNNFIFAFNVTAFGVNVGKKFYGLFELNAGYDAIVKVGIGARF